MTLLVLAEGPQDDPAPALIRLLRLDFNTPGVSVLSLPSDLWVSTQALPGLEAGTLKQVYEQARGAAPGEEKVASQLATQYLAVALEENFGFTPDHYLTINRLAFTNMVKTLGGIALLVYAKLGSAEQGQEIIDAGLQALAALGGLDFLALLQEPGQINPDQFVSPERRGEMLDLLRGQMAQPENWARLAALIDHFYSQLATDLSLEQLFMLSCMVEAAGGNISVVPLPPGMVSQDAAGHQVPDSEQIRLLIDAVMAED
jgi:anionic cell wall polymer biosynthesis LytR-Cps2A-Psr (LCP) family protein